MASPLPRGLTLQEFAALHPVVIPELRQSCPAVDRAAAKVAAHARQTMRQAVRARAINYLVQPRQMEMLVEGVSQMDLEDALSCIRSALAFERIKSRRFMGFGGEVPLLNLRGAELALRYRRRREAKQPLVSAIRQHAARLVDEAGEMAAAALLIFGAPVAWCVIRLVEEATRAAPV